MMTVEEIITKKGLLIHRDYILKMVDTKYMSLPERWGFFKVYFVPCLTNTDSEMSIKDDKIVIKEDTDVLGGILYLYNILRGKAKVIDLVKK